MNIGKKFLFKFGNSSEIEKLRRIIDIYSYGIHYILNNHSSLTFLLKAEKKLQIDKDIIYSIKHYIEKLKKSIKKDIFCLTVDNNIVWASSDWLNIHITDRILFLLLSKVFSSGDLMELPIYFTKTQLEDEGVGISPYKIIIVNLMKNTKLLIVTDNNLELENLEKDNIKIIEDNIHIFKKLKLNYDKTNIISKRIDELYADIIIGLFENTDIDYIYKIIEELNFESIDITEKIFKRISVFLNNNEKFKNEYLIINNDDLLNDNKINFYYLLLDYILKNSTFIYQFNCILKTKKYFLKLIKSNSNFYLSNNKNNKLEKIIKKIIDSNYY
jgi:hypothetical protein